MNASLDLFGTPLVPGLATGFDIVTPGEETELAARIDATDLTPFEFQGWFGKRLTQSFGTRYDFSNGSLDLADAIPDWLDPLRRRAARFAGLPPEDLLQALLTRYDPGAGIGWHKDRPVHEHVVGVSLGAPATMRFRRKSPRGFKRVNAPLPPRSIYHLTGEVRHDWEHSIAEMERTRWSITFRSLSERGLQTLRDRPGQDPTVR